MNRARPRAPLAAPLVAIAAVCVLVPLFSATHNALSAPVSTRVRVGVPGYTGALSAATVGPARVVRGIAPSLQRETRARAEEGNKYGFRGSFVFDPDEDVKQKAETTVKEALETSKAIENATEADLFNNLAMVIKESKGFGIDDRDVKLYTRMERAAKDLESKYGYRYEMEQLYGDWKLLFTTSAAYRRMGGMTGFSKAMGSSLDSLYQQLRNDEVTNQMFAKALRSLLNVEEAEEVKDCDPAGSSTTVEVLTVFGGAKVKNEIRGVFLLDEFEDAGRKFTGVDQICYEGDSGGQENIPAPARALQICTYISSDNQFRISRSPSGTLFFFQRVEDLEGDFDKMGVPARGGSTWGTFFK